MPLIDNINELSNRIYFKTALWGKDKIGNKTIIGYEDGHSCWGKVLKRSVRDIYEAGANWDDNSLQVAIRSLQDFEIKHNDFLTIDSEKRIYVVKEINKDMNKKEFDILVCTEKK